MRRGLRTRRVVLLIAGVGAGTAATLSFASAGSFRETHHSMTVAVGHGFSCPTGPGRPTVVTTPPDPRLAASLAVLRRPATPGDAPDADALRNLQVGDGVHLGDARLLRSDATARAWLVPADDVRPRPLSERCIARAPADRRTELQQERERFLAQPAQPGVVILTDGRSDVGPSIARLEDILAGRALEENSCAGPSKDMLGLYALLPDDAREPHLRFRDGHTVLGDLRDNAVTFLLAKPVWRELLPTALVWSDAAGNAHESAITGGAFSVEHCAAPPRYVVSRPAAGPGPIEATARGGTPDATLGALAAEVHVKPNSVCPTIGLADANGLGHHVETYCVGAGITAHDRFFVSALRSRRLANRAMLVGLADPKVVRDRDDGQRVPGPPVAVGRVLRGLPRRPVGRPPVAGARRAARAHPDPLHRLPHDRPGADARGRRSRRRGAGHQPGPGRAFRRVPATACPGRRASPPPRPGGLPPRRRQPQPVAVARHRRRHAVLRGAGCAGPVPGGSIFVRRQRGMRPRAAERQPRHSRRGGRWSSTAPCSSMRCCRTASTA